MKRSKLLAILTLCALSTGVLTAVVATPGTISVNSQVTKEIEPNKAVLSFAVETSSSSAEKASEENKTIANNVLSAVKKELTPDVDLIKTSNFMVQPEYYYTKENKRVLNDYKATNTVNVIVNSDVKKIGKIIDLALKYGANRVNNVDMSLENPNKYCADLLAEAALETKVKADSVANSLGSKVTGVKSINTSCGLQSGTVRYMSNYMLDVAYASSAKAAGSAVPIEVGKLKIYANVDANYNIK